MNDPWIMTKIIEENFILLEDVEMIDQNGLKTFLVKLKVGHLYNLFGNQYKYIGAENKEANLERFRKSVDRDYVENVTECVLQGSFLQVGDISINILNAGGKELTYDRENKVLTIFGGTEIAVIEGYQIYLGIERALQINQDIDLNLIVKFSYSNLHELCEYFVQRAKER